MQRLLDAALQLFSERDYANVTIKDIAAAADINPALIYYYFESKEGLFRAALEKTVESFISYYQMLRQRHSDPVDLITDWFDTHVEASRAVQQLIKILLDYSSTRTQTTVIDDIIRQFYDEERRLLSEILEEGIRSGQFEKVDCERTAVFASTHLDGVITRSLIMPDMDIRQAVDDFKAVFWQHVGYRR